MDDVLAVFDESLTALSASSQKKGGGLNAGLWDYSVPRSKVLARIVLSYAKDGRLDTQVEGEGVAWFSLSDEVPQVLSEGLLIKYTSSVLGGKPVTTDKLLMYPLRSANKLHALFNGVEVQYGSMTVCLGSIIPKLIWTGDKLSLMWEKPMTLRWKTGFFGRLTIGSLRSITIDESYGNFDVGGITGWMLPRLVWK